MRVLIALVLGAQLVGCQCVSEAQVGDGDGGGGGGLSTGGGAATGGGSGGGGTHCAVTCETGSFCSANGHCLPNGTCGSDDDCSAGHVCSPDAGSCIPGSSCGSTAVNAGRVVPNVLIALDRSCSMTHRVGAKSKWQIAVEAVGQLTTVYDSKMRFGLTLFPDTSTPSCEQGAIPIPLGDGNEATIRARLTAALDAGHPEFPKGPCVTNIDTGVLQAATDPGLADLQHPGFLALITDGRQAGCAAGGGNNGTLSAIRTLAATNVKTFVVGFDNAGGIDVPSLNAFAQAGGEVAPTAADGGYKFFNAQDEASLRAALDLIASRAMGCTYALTQVPPDSSQLFVFFDRALTPRDSTHQDGWDYSSVTNQVTFSGPACERLRAGQVARLDIVYGCPGVN